jgi:NTE family protein
MSRKNQKIALVLGSGSARGWAHIGVIRELEAMGIKIDAIAGCSIGSLVGGVYALGRLNELEMWARSLTFKQMALLLDPSFASGGILRGERVFKALRKFQFEGNIEDLPLKFAAVATDMDTGDEIWIKDGSLLDAMRASSALPGLLAPQKRGQK